MFTSYAAVEQVCNADSVIVALGRDSSDIAQLQALKAALFDINDADTKCTYGLIYCLGSLTSGSVKEGMLTRTQLLRAYANNLMVERTLSDANISDTCDDCGGLGVLDAQCKVCAGSGKCKVCGGTGKRTDVNQFSAPSCPVCGGTGFQRERVTESGYDYGSGRAVRKNTWRRTNEKCLRCEGSGRLAINAVTCLGCRGSRDCGSCGGKGRSQVKCAACNGTRYVLSPQKCRAAYVELLSKTATRIEASSAQAVAVLPATAEADTAVATASEPMSAAPVVDPTPLPEVMSHETSQAATSPKPETQQVVNRGHQADLVAYLRSPLILTIVIFIGLCWLISLFVRH
ncbi:MAG: hypothetical protein PHR35_07270 [Kiritimatiellae bacterium]|nr:hypothetical protein [Kiritimatiellia bacterium]